MPQPPVGLNVEGRATIEGREVAHTAVPAENMMQAFEYRHLVPAEELEVAISGRYSLRATAKLLSRSPLKIPAGGTATVRIGITPRTLIGKFQVSLRRPPEGISIENVSASRDAVEITLQSDAAKSKRRPRGTLEFEASLEKPGSPDKAKQTVPRSLLPTLPSVPFEIVTP
jgi:hypothetical protein